MKPAPSCLRRDRFRPRWRAPKAGAALPEDWPWRDTPARRVIVKGEREWSLIPRPFRGRSGSGCARPCPTRWSITANWWASPRDARLVVGQHGEGLSRGNRRPTSRSWEVPRGRVPGRHPGMEEQMGPAADETRIRWTTRPLPDPGRYEHAIVASGIDPGEGGPLILHGKASPGSRMRRRALSVVPPGLPEMESAQPGGSVDFSHFLPDLYRLAAGQGPGHQQAVFIGEDLKNDLRPNPTRRNAHRSMPGDGREPARPRFRPDARGGGASFANTSTKRSSRATRPNYAR